MLKVSLVARECLYSSGRDLNYRLEVILLYMTSLLCDSNSMLGFLRVAQLLTSGEMWTGRFSVGNYVLFDDWSSFLVP